MCPFYKPWPLNHAFYTVQKIKPLFPPPNAVCSSRDTLLGAVSG